MKGRLQTNYSRYVEFFYFDQNIYSFEAVYENNGREKRITFIFSHH